MGARIQLSVAFCGAAIIAVTLWSWGQPLICACGVVKFWVPQVFSPDNSQHIADWYTFSHILHGVLVVLAARLLAPRLPFAILFWIAVITGVGWEVVEHTEWVLSKFRDGIEDGIPFIPLIDRSGAEFGQHPLDMLHNLPPDTSDHRDPEQDRKGLAWGKEAGDQHDKDAVQDMR